MADATAMEYVVELQSANGERITVAPYYRAFLDRRDMKLNAADYGLDNEGMEVDDILLLCMECSDNRNPLLPIHQIP